MRSTWLQPNQPICIADLCLYIVFFNFSLNSGVVAGGWWWADGTNRSFSILWFYYIVTSGEWMVYARGVRVCVTVWCNWWIAAHLNRTIDDRRRPIDNPDYGPSALQPAKARERKREGEIESEREMMVEDEVLINWRIRENIIGNRSNRSNVTRFMFVCGNMWSLAASFFLFSAALFRLVFLSSWSSLLLLSSVACEHFVAACSGSSSSS